MTAKGEKSRNRESLGWVFLAIGWPIWIYCMVPILGFGFYIVDATTIDYLIEPSVLDPGAITESRGWLATE
jgi:hypothetical protein